MRQQQSKTYFKVFCLKDRTPFMALPTRKPLEKTLNSWGEQIDEDGVWRWLPHDDKELDRFIDTARHLTYATIANSINMKRAIRTQAEPKLNALIKQVAAIKEQLDRMERKMNASDPVTLSPS
jgi:hypothetical protein